ncbi:hypothetical protein F2Q68_00004336 [Brassica cretica]|uniref:Uncharacterized protein n=1 Tax=Brassica cretica TaxID=69181 RepID=A0A8S9JGV9_BRACR|nr:hypothetical protein F2Q68_00004336 [Brassica cretica]
MHAVRSLRNDRARAKLGRYVMTELEPSSVITCDSIRFSRLRVARTRNLARSTSCLGKNTSGRPSDPCHFGRFGNQWHKPCSCEEKHLERQARPRDSQAKTPAPRNRRDKLHDQGAGESPYSASRRPGHITHCSELPGKKDTGRQWKLRQHHLPGRIQGPGAGGKRSNSEDDPPYRVQWGSQANRQGNHAERKDQGVIAITEQPPAHHTEEPPLNCSRLATATGPSDPCHFGRFGNQWHKPCSCEEKHLERQARPRDSQAKAPAPRNRRDKLHDQGAGESPYSASRRPGHIAHCSELPGKMDTGRQWKLRQHHLPGRIQGPGAGGKRSNSEDNPPYRVQWGSQANRQGNHAERKDQGVIAITEQPPAHHTEEP